MFSITSSYIRAIKYIIALVKFKEDKINLIDFKDEIYKGLDGKDVIVRVFYTNKKYAQSIIIFPGASPYAEEHPKMQMLGIILAQNGYKVFIPRIPPLKILDISVVNVEWFICFYQWVLNKYHLESQNITMIGTSYGGGIMLKAYLQFKSFLPIPKILMTHGTYADAESTLRFLLTGEISNNGVQYKMTPHEWGIIVLFQNYLKNLDLDWDTIGVQEAINLQIQEKFEDRDKVISNLPRFQKNIVNSVLSGKRTAEIMVICQEILQNEVTTLQDLSPKYWCHKIQKKVFIFHGANDSMVPFTESIQLAERIPDSELLISNIYEHKEISTNKGTYFKLKEFMRMVHFFSRFYYYHEN